MSNSIAFVAPKPSWIAANKPLTWACFPMLAVLIVVIGISVFEATEDRRFQTRVLQMRTEGIPVDTVSLVKWTRARTHPEGTMAWSEISVMQRMLSLMRHESPSRFGIPEDNDLHRTLFLGVDALNDEHIAGYLEKLRPLFKSVEQAVEFPNPVMQYTGIDRPVLIGFDDISRDLRLEMMHAIYHRQIERATIAMDLLLRVNDVQEPGIDSEEFGIFRYWGRRSEYTAISRSLNVALWDEPYLRKLIERLQPERTLAQSWRAMIVRNRALGLDEIPRLSNELFSEVQNHNGMESQAARFFPFPRELMTGSVKNWLLDTCEAVEPMADDGYPRLEARAETINKKLGIGTFFFFAPVPYEFRRFRYEAGDWINSENHRRLSRTALAIKHFEMTKGQWPKSLDELSEVEFLASETQTVQGERFGYEVDGESAFVWQFRAHMPGVNFTDVKRLPIVSNLKSFKVAIEDVDGSELVRIR